MRLFGSSRLPAFIDRQTKAVARVFNYYWDHFDGRLHALEEMRVSWQDATADVSRLALDRINEILVPAIASVAEMQAHGFLIAHSASSNELAATNVLTFAIDDEAERRLFTPSPFLALTRAATADDYAVARRVAWDSEAGMLVCEVVAAYGDPGPHDDWVIAALAGSTMAQVEMLAGAMAARDAAVVARGGAEDARDLASGSAGTAGTAAGNAAAARDKAQKWAQEEEDVAVEAGRYSALHHAAKAAASASAAATFDPSAYLSKAGDLAGLASAATARNNLGLGDAATRNVGTAAGTVAAGDDSRIENAVQKNVTTQLSAGYTATSDNDGTKSSGTYTPVPAEGNFKNIVNGGAFTLAAPAGVHSMVIQIDNNASAGAITMSGFTKVGGSSFTTTNGHKFLVYITRTNSYSHANVVALQ